MKATNRKMAVSVLTLAVQGALLAMTAPSALAQDASVAELTTPDNYVEIGISSTSDKSAKFGEYNGLNKKGADLIGNFSVKGGAYGTDTGTTRWSVTGADLGTDSRELGATVGSQGKWSLGVGFDQLRHYITDTYQTPYQGSLGGNTFTLPATFGGINAARGKPGALSLTATQLGAFQTQDVYSERKNTSFNAGYNFDDQWSIKFDYKQIDQSGGKLIAAATDALAFGTYTSGFEKTAILMNPTSFKTENFSLALNWVGDKGYFTGEYYGSLFHDDYSGVTFSNPFLATPATFVTGTNIGAFPLNMMSTAPSNQFHQFNLTGGYNFTPATHLTGGISYARNTQNQSYDGTYTPGTMPGLPVNSLDALVVTKHTDLRLTHQATKALSLSAGYKYNERDNRTASNTYNYLNLGGDNLFAVNAPMSNKRTQFDLNGDYRIDGRQHVRAGYEYDKIERWCNNGLANTAVGEAPVDGTATPVNTTCAQVPQSKEDRFNLDYRLHATETVSFNAGYTHGNRKSDVNQAFYNPMQSFTEGYENLGYLAFFQASRKEDLLKLGVNWQASPKLNFGVSGRYGKDDYYDAVFGVQQGETSSLNLDASYNYSSQSTVAAYITGQHRTRDMTDGNGRHSGTLATQQWANSLSDDSLTLGISGKQHGLMAGKLELSEDLTYSVDKTDYSTNTINYACTATTCGSFPTIKGELTQFKLTGKYSMDKASQVMLGYLYQHLNSSDPTYYYMYGYASTTNKSGILPTNQQPGSYNQNVVFASYIYNFK